MMNEVPDESVFDIDPTHVGTGAVWDADRKAIPAYLSKVVPLPLGTRLEGSLEIVDRRDCGWASCFDVRRKFEGNTATDAVLGGVELPHGKFSFDTRIELPARPDFLSFSQRDQVRYEARSDASGETGSFVQGSIDVKRRVLVDDVMIRLAGVN
jgi:hypothetical protein